MSVSMRPRLFIGSSAEHLDVANAIQTLLERDVLGTVWNQGVFELSGVAFLSLIRAAQDSDAAVFVLAPNDVAKIRGSERSVPRDNVIFELGLFIGRLGVEKVYFVVPRGMPNLHLPTDILGLTYADYEAARPDGNLHAALGPACDNIRRQLKSLFPGMRNGASALKGKEISDDEALSVIVAWMDRSVMDVLTRLHRHSEVDELLGLVGGTAARLIGQAASRSSRRVRLAVDNGEVFQLVRVV